MVSGGRRKGAGRKPIGDKAMSGVERKRKFDKEHPAPMTLTEFRKLQKEHPERYFKSKNVWLEDLHQLENQNEYYNTVIAKDRLKQGIPAKGESDNIPVEKRKDYGIDDERQINIMGKQKEIENRRGEHGEKMKRGYDKWTDPLYGLTPKEKAEYIEKHKGDDAFKKQLRKLRLGVEGK